MHAERGALRVAVASVLVFAAACGRSDDLAGPGAASPDVLPRQTASSADPEDLDRRVPGFGGFFVDRDGIPTVYLVGGAGRRAAEEALDGFLRERGMGPDRLRVLPGRFTHRQLEGWHQRATPQALDVPGAVFVDNDEAGNRVRIGVEDLSADGGVRAALLRLGIPAEAVVIERADPIFLVATLQNIIDRPVRAGVQINFPGFVCSVGFNANSGSQRSFVTASHCTNNQGGVENTPYWQPTQTAAPGQIATEVADPAYFRRGVCPPGRRCRYSDAARANYLSAANQALGVIARTSGANNGSLEVVGSFTITAEDQRDHFTTNEVIQKVGRTTGWTSGRVSGTCVNVSVSGTQFVQLCQTLVNSTGGAIVGGGDSGSGVFQVVSGTNVRLGGILWGGNGSGTQFVFSPLRNVERELGALTTF